MANSDDGRKVCSSCKGAYLIVVYLIVDPAAKGVKMSLKHLKHAKPVVNVEINVNLHINGLVHPTHPVHPVHLVQRAHRPLDR